MTGLRIPDHAINRVLRKRGRLAIFDDIDPRRTALLVIDMQCHYLDVIQTMPDIVPVIQRLSQRLRDAGCKIAWLLNTLERDGVDLWPHYHRHFYSPDEATKHRTGLASGSAGHRLIPDLKQEPTDWVVEKTRFSAFAPGSSPLEPMLDRANIDTLVLAGVSTNVCCEATARDAMMRDMRVIVVGDAMAAVTEEDHCSGLGAMITCFADVRSGDQVLSLITNAHVSAMV